MPTYNSRRDFEALPNVRGTAIGPGPNATIVVLVTQKVAESRLSDTDTVPDEVTIDGTTYKTDVVPVGIPHLLCTTDAETTVADHRARHRPIPGGVSMGNSEIGAGTVGLSLLYHGKENAPVALTNSHVTSGAWNHYQPARMDGGTNDEAFGTLRDESDLDPARVQTTDSALISVSEDDVTDEVLGLGPLLGFETATYDHSYQKSGRTTAVSGAELLGTDATILVTYGPETIRFDGVDVFGDMSNPGDSGSVIGRSDPGGNGVYVADLLYAGSDRATIGVPMDAVQAYHGSLTIPRDLEPEEPEEPEEPDEPDEPDEDENGGDEQSPSWGRFRHQARVENIVDGDTMDFTVAIGLNTTRTDQRIRLLGIDTAETNVGKGSDEYQLGMEQKQFVAEWFAEAKSGYTTDDDPEDPHLLWPVVLDTYKDRTDSFGRLLTHVQRKIDGQDLADALIAEYGDDVRYEIEEQLSRLLR